MSGDLELNTHYNSIGNLLEVGRLVFFLGAGANLCGRSRSETWRPGRDLPDGTDLAQYLADKWRYQPRPLELGRVAQFIEHEIGDGPLNDQLHDLFDADYPPTELHAFLADLPALLAERGYPSGIILLSTNYDDVLERAFEAADQPFELLTYLNTDSNADQRDVGGRFLHMSQTGGGTLIKVPNEYLLETDVRRDLMRPVIIKLHGAVDRIRREFDSFVISEDDYVDYLALTPEEEFLTAQLRGLLKNRHFLFLGYGLRDWNLRVILRRIWRERASRRHSFAVVLDADELEEQFWRDKDVEMLRIDLLDYVMGLRSHVTALPAKEPL